MLNLLFERNGPAIGPNQGDLERKHATFLVGEVAQRHVHKVSPRLKERVGRILAKRLVARAHNDGTAGGGRRQVDEHPWRRTPLRHQADTVDALGQDAVPAAMRHIQVVNRHFSRRPALVLNPRQWRELSWGPRGALARWRLVPPTKLCAGHLQRVMHPLHACVLVPQTLIEVDCQSARVCVRPRHVTLAECSCPVVRALRRCAINNEHWCVAKGSDAGTVGAACD
mmetsp:Transcript_35548/g.83898  ORF Transcript_35548/g.83898 Transcript_35548/m.83898 type:complete len:226 (+) Transcript_35548:534-1211(+)